MSPEKDVREGFEERLNIFVKRANTRVEYRVGSQRGLADTNKLNAVRVVQNGNKLLKPTTKGSRQERSLVPSCKITMSGAIGATTGGRIATS